MLVVLCAIRKMLECIFTKRELRLLDDLLPEAGMGVRRGRSPHKHKHKRHNSGADMELAEELTVGQIRNWRQLVMMDSRASVFSIGFHYRVLIPDAINLCLRDHCSNGNRQRSAGKPVPSRNRESRSAWSRIQSRLGYFLSLGFSTGFV